MLKKKLDHPYLWCRCSRYSTIERKVILEKWHY